MNILFVEDDSSLSSLFKAQLKRLGKKYTATSASTRLQAMNTYKNEKFDLVFLDMSMEGNPEQGLEILQEIQKMNPGQRVVILSSYDGPEMIKKCKEAGAEFYMVKPFSFEGLQVLLTQGKEGLKRYQSGFNEGRIYILC